MKFFSEKAFILGLLWILIGPPAAHAADEPGKQPPPPSGDVQERSPKKGTSPDVAKTPSPGGPVPIPYPNVTTDPKPPAPTPPKAPTPSQGRPQ